MTNATVQCEVCSKTKRFANATVDELHLKKINCEGCGRVLIMEKKTDCTLWGFDYKSWTEYREMFING